MKPLRIVLLVLALAALAAAGWWLARPPHRHTLVAATDAQGQVYYTCPMHPQIRQDKPGHCPICGMALVKKVEGAAPAKPARERRILYWYDPMVPDKHFDRPGKSPFMDMELVPKYANEAVPQTGSAAADSVHIDPRIVQRLGIRTAPVTRSSFAPRIEATGVVEVDERRMVAVISRTAGFVERLQLRAVGDPVRRGQSVAAVYSPELYAAQEELLLAARSGDAALLQASKQRLALLGLSAGQIESVLRSGRAQRQAAVLSPSDGVVTELNVREGEQVQPGTPLMRIADLSHVWIGVDIPEAQGGAIGADRPVEVRLAALPGRVFEGRVEYLYPRLETSTRTLRARLVLDNPELALKPGMYAQVSLLGGARSEALVIPSEALIRTGERSLVILAEGEGRFRPALVKPGADRAGQTEILAGLQEGETVVVSGQFLIDSEANLRSVLARMLPAPEVAP